MRHPTRSSHTEAPGRAPPRAVIPGAPGPERRQRKPAGQDKAMLSVHCGPRRTHAAPEATCRGSDRHLRRDCSRLASIDVRGRDPGREAARSSARRTTSAPNNEQVTHPQHTLSRGMLRPKKTAPRRAVGRRDPCWGYSIARARGHLEGDLLHHMLQINCALISRQQDDSVAVPGDGRWASAGERWFEHQLAH